MNVPHFDLPEKNLTFLATKEKRYTYNDLYVFAEKLRDQISDLHPSEKKPLLLFADSTAETVLVIASAFLLKFPIFTLHPETTHFELEEVLKLIEPSAIYAPKLKEAGLLKMYPFLDFDEETENSTAIPDFTDFKFDAPENLAGYFLTSGSTGSPKIVPIKRRQVLFGAESSSKNIKPAKNKFWLLCLPLNHVGGINVIYRSILYHSAVYLVRSFDADKIHKLLNENKSFEAASMVPTMLDNLLEHSFFRVQFNFKGLLLGGGPISMELINRSLTRGIPIVISYGMTETCAQIAANSMLRPSGMYTPKQSVGRIFEPNQIEIRSENSQPLPYNESGYIWLKGPQVFDGYLDENMHSEYFDNDGWFNTGDIGHMNRKKQLFIENRRSDMIITGGENVNPVEIENLLNGIKSIKESAVIGVPDKKWGQKVVAFIVTQDDQTDFDLIEKILRNSVRSFKIPKEFILMSALPKTETHKIKKGELLSIYQKNS